MRRGRKKSELKQQEIIIRAPASIDREVVAMSRNMSYSFICKTEIQKWTLLQQKIFFLMLSQIDWKKTGNSNVVEIANAEAIEKLNWQMQGRSKTEFSCRMKEEVNSMMKNSFISLQDPFSKKWSSDFLITHAEGTSFSTKIELNPKFMNHFERLYEAAKQQGANFISFLEYDTYQIESSFGMKLLILLNNESLHNGSINTKILTTKQIKDIMGMPEDAYCRDYDPLTESYSSFDRSNFEKKVICRAIDEVNKSETTKILPYDDGKYFRKIKKGRFVAGYEIRYRVLNVDMVKKARKRTVRKKKVENS